MKTKHIFVPLLDVGEIVPFTLKKTESIAESLSEQDRIRDILAEFINGIEQGFGEGIFYLGFDEIGGKFYERFMFEHGGFLEIMIEAPLAMNAHFISQERAERFLSSLKQTLLSILPNTPITKMFVDSLQVQTQEDDSLTYRKWETMKDINK